MRWHENFLCFYALWSRSFYSTFASRMLWHLKINQANNKEWYAYGEKQMVSSYFKIETYRFQSLSHALRGSYTFVDIGISVSLLSYTYILRFRHQEDAQEVVTMQLCSGVIGVQVLDVIPILEIGNPVWQHIQQDIEHRRIYVRAHMNFRGKVPMCCTKWLYIKTTWSLIIYFRLNVYYDIAPTFPNCLCWVNAIFASICLILVSFYK